MATGRIWTGQRLGLGAEIEVIRDNRKSCKDPPGGHPDYRLGIRHGERLCA